MFIYFYAYQGPQVKHIWFQKDLSLKINVINVENVVCIRNSSKNAVLYISHLLNGFAKPRIAKGRSQTLQAFHARTHTGHAHSSDVSGTTSERVRL